MLQFLCYKKTLNVVVKDVKWILPYLKGAEDVGVVFGSNRNTDRIVEYVDSILAGDLEKGRSLIGYVFTITSWKANLQYIVALSTT